MQIKLIKRSGTWVDVYEAALYTIGKTSLGRTSSDEWKEKMIRAEHSPIRLLWFTFELKDVKYWVVNHLTRHKIGVEFFVKTQRTDKTGINRNELKQDNPVDLLININAQALINISRKRLCKKASPETREVWMKLIDELRDYEPILASKCVPECQYRQKCPEFEPCYKK